MIFQFYSFLGYDDVNVSWQAARVNPSKSIKASRVEVEKETTSLRIRQTSGEAEWERVRGREGKKENHPTPKRTYQAFNV